MQYKYRYASESLIHPAITMSSFLVCSWATGTPPIAQSSSASSSLSYSSSHRVFFPNECMSRRRRSHAPSCSNAQNDDNDDKGKLDRREMLIGLGGLYGAASNLGSDPLAMAAPIPAPDLNTCGPATNLNNGEPVPYSCCPPVNNRIIDFRLPSNPGRRIRPAAHLVSIEYANRFNLAMQRMRNLPANDPRNFMQQANVHCAYCNGAYEQYPTGSSINRLEIQVHNCWLFFPFHRWYLYFFERILGSLINDPTFGLPYWNWDDRAGLFTPGLFMDSQFWPALFNQRRNFTNTSRPVDLGYFGVDDNFTWDVEGIVNRNCVIMYNEMVRNARTLEHFMGEPYRRGSFMNPGAGTHEAGSHTAIHIWMGDPREPSGEDLGNFYSAGRDPLFYAHHANVDRMWTLWRNRRPNNQRDFRDPDYLNAQFLFYDENNQLVRVRVADCLDNRLMGYEYQTQGVRIPWLSCVPRARVQRSSVARTSNAPKLDTIQFPLKLDNILKVVVPRPKTSRTQEEKEKEEEVLVIDGIEVDTEKFVKFDIFVNEEEDDFINLDKAEYGGTFGQVPHKHKTPLPIKTKKKLELTKQLEDLGVEDDAEILVTIVRRAGDITIGGIKITYESA